MSVEPQREWFEKNYYEILGVPETAETADITKAYRKLARRLHPDANAGDSTSEERFKEVSGAYDVLGDAEKRKAYDEVRRLGPMASGFGGRQPGGFDFRFEQSGGDLGDLLGGLFGKGRGGGRSDRSRRGNDLETELRIDFADAVRGVTTSVELLSDASCRSCSGSGAATGSTSRSCGTCDGTGVHNDNQGLFSFSRPCTACAGRGLFIDEPCTSCSGSGVERRARKIKLRLPAGVRDGQKVKLAGRGGTSHSGGPPGDLYVRVRVEPHRLFGRSGSDLTLTLPITFAEAALGADIAVPRLDGSKVTMRIPPGTASGRTFRVRAKEAGPDLLVAVEVVVPSGLSNEQRSAVEALAAAGNDDPRSHLGV